MLTALVTASVILVVLCLIVSASATARYMDYLSGYWTVHPDFAAKAKLSEFQLFIGPREANRSEPRAGYLIVVDHAGEPLANRPVDITATARAGSALVAAARARHDEFQGRLEIAATGAASPLGIPGALDFSLSTLDGTLTLFDKGAVYACLVKDIATSEIALRAYETGAIKD